MKFYHWAVAILFFFAIACITIIGDTRNTYGDPNVYIGSPDQAQMAIIARNIADGNGAVSECYWLLHGVDTTSDKTLPISEKYWSPYLPWIMAGFFKGFGSSRFTVLLAASLTKVVIATLAWIICYLCSRRLLESCSCGIVLLLHEAMLNRVNGLSDIYVTLTVLIFVASICHSLSCRSWLGWIIAGSVAGIAIGLKPTGYLLLGIYPLTFLFNRSSKLLPQISLSLVALLVTVSPFLISNTSDGGLLLPRDVTRVKSAANLRSDTGNMDLAFYDPDPAIVLKRNTKEKIKDHVRNVLKNIQILSTDDFPHALLPFTIVGLAAGLKLYKTQDFRCTTYNQLFSACTCALMMAGIVLASQVHFEARYFNFLVPLIVICCFSTTSTFSNYIRLPITFFLIVSISLTAASHYWRKPTESVWEKRQVAFFIEAKKHLPTDATVFTSFPWQFSYHTQLKSVMVPYTDQSQTLLRVAKRFGVKFLVILDNFTRNPYLDTVIDESYPDYLDPVHRGNGVIICRIKYDDTRSD